MRLAEVMPGRRNCLCKGPEVGGMGMVFREWGVEELEVAGEKAWQRAQWAGQGDAIDAQVRSLGLTQGF